MTAIVLIWLGLVLLEAFRNSKIIVKKRVSPKHKGAFWLRVVVGIVFWIGTPVVYSDLWWDSWWMMAPMMALTFWWLFDSSLNLLRGRKIWWLGDPDDPEEDSWIDNFQLKTFGAWPWFWFKLFLAGASITVFYKGFDIL